MKINATKGGIFLDNKISSVQVFYEDNSSEEFALFADRKANQSMVDLFKKTDGGVTFGKPGDEPEPYLKQAVIDELSYFTDVLFGKKSCAERPELFGGEAALHAVKVAEACLLSKKCGFKVAVEKQNIIR